MNQPHAADPHAQDEAAAHAAAVRNRSVMLLAGAAVLISLTGPLWFPVLLTSLNIQSDSQRQAAASRVLLDRFERRAGGFDQQLTATSDAAAGLQAGAARETMRTEQTARAMASLAVTELGAALRQPGGFVHQLAAARTAVAATPEFADLVRQIDPYAETGIPGRERLRQYLVRVQAATGGDDTSALGMVRRAIGVPAASGDSGPTALAEAIQRLREDDLAASIAAVRSMPDPRPAWVNEWLDDASARLAADTLIRRVDELVTARGRSSRP